jgi:hypothetical protein
MGIIGQVNLQNVGANINFQNEGKVGQVNSQALNGANTFLGNNGQIGEMNSYTRAAETNIYNCPTGQIGTLNATDQWDKTNILNRGQIGTANLTAIGALGEINMQNQGMVGTLNAHAKIGGEINVNNLFGMMGQVNALATGSSHGQQSQFNLLT